MKLILPEFPHESARVTISIGRDVHPHAKMCILSSKVRVDLPLSSLTELSILHYTAPWRWRITISSNFLRANTVQQYCMLFQQSAALEHDPCITVLGTVYWRIILWLMTVGCVYSSLWGPARSCCLLFMECGLMTIIRV